MDRDKLTMLLKNDMKPALGVTEVGAIALCSARACAIVDGIPEVLQLTVNGALYKNAFSCAIPPTGELGCEMAAALGAVAGDWTLGLEVLKNASFDDVAKAKELIKNKVVTVAIAEDEPEIYIRATARCKGVTGTAVIRKFHNHFVLLQRNEEILFQQDASEASSLDIDFDALTVEALYEYCKTVPYEEISFLEEMITMNRELAQAGAMGVGLKIKDTLESYRKIGVLSDDIIYAAQRLTCNALDARLAGLPLPAMSIAGSGSHGILCSLPIVAYMLDRNISMEETLRSLAFSALLTIYIKHYSGRLSPLCGCVIGGGTGTSAGLVFLMGGTAKQAGDAINHMAAGLTGMVCDGGSIGCVLKASSGIYSAYLSAMLAMQSIALPPNFGILGSTPEQTIYNIGRISSEGMYAVDKTTISIMQGGK